MNNMKKLRKVLALVLAMVMVLGMSTMAFADEPTTGTITVENATYGKTYTAYKVFDASYSASDHSKVSYTVTADKKHFVDTTLFDVSTAADKNGKYAVSAKKSASEEAILNWVKANYSNFDSTGTPGTFNTDNYTVTFANVPFGYYYITSTLGSAVAINTTNPTVTVKDKNASAPTNPVKKIYKVDGEDKDAYTDDVHVGSVIGFKITGNATNWTTTGEGNNVTATKNETYTFEDTFTNLTVDESSYVVKVNGTVTTNYTATISGNKITVTIPLNDAYGNALYQATDKNSAYIPIEMTYNATITAAAAGAPAKNEIGDETDTLYTYAFQVAKTDDRGVALPGAQFELWSTKNVEGATAAALKFIYNGDGTYTYSEEGTVTTLDMTTNTTIVIKGLDNAWSYTLKETKVPDGYNQAEDKTIEGSSLTKVEEDTDTTPASTALHKETVVNKQGATLPSTGGIGTTIFYIIGAILVIGASVVLVTRRRMNAN